MRPTLGLSRTFYIYPSGTPIAERNAEEAAWICYRDPTTEERESFARETMRVAKQEDREVPMSALLKDYALKLVEGVGGFDTPDDISQEAALEKWGSHHLVKLGNYAYVLDNEESVGLGKPAPPRVSTSGGGSARSGGTSSGRKRTAST